LGGDKYVHQLDITNFDSISAALTQTRVLTNWIRIWLELGFCGMSWYYVLVLLETEAVGPSSNSFMCTSSMRDLAQVHRGPLVCWQPSIQFVTIWPTSAQPTRYSYGAGNQPPLCFTHEIKVFPPPSHNAFAPINFKFGAKAPCVHHQPVYTCTLQTCILYTYVCMYTCILHAYDMQDTWERLNTCDLCTISRHTFIGKICTCVHICIRVYMYTAGRPYVY
jgi:hypothetical protein